MTSTRSTTRANIGRVHCHFPIADHRVRVAGVCTSCPIEPFLGDRELVLCANHEPKSPQLWTVFLSSAKTSDVPRDYRAQSTTF